MKTLIRAIAIAALGLFAATAKADLYTLNDNEDWSGRTQDLPTMVDLNGYMLTIDGAAFSSTRFTATSDSQSVLRVSVDEGQSATVKSDALSGNLKLVKIGSGRLIVPPLRIETECLQGELGVKGVYPVTGKPIHRWSFTGGSLDDSVGGATAKLVGAKSGQVTFANNAVTFPGGNNGECYLDMGAGVIPESGEVTIEVWGTQNEAKDWSRIWCVGRDDINFLTMGWTWNGNVNNDFIQLKENKTDFVILTGSLGPFSIRTQFHISMKILPGADGKTRLEWSKRDVSTGEILKSGSAETSGPWSLANIANCNFWLNHGFGNSDASATYDEVRIWNWALSDQELTDNVTAGPDVILEREKEGVVVEEKVEEPEAPVVLHRWSFTGGSLNDSVGGSTAALVGAKSSEVTFANNTVTFPGGDNGECCLDMGAGVIPESGEVTIEVWCTQNETKDWSRIWCVGRDNNNFLSMFWTYNGRINNDFIQLADNKSKLIQTGPCLAPYTVGTQFHISMKIFSVADGKTKLEWAKRDVSTGQVLKSGSAETSSPWSLANIANCHFWLNHGFENSDASASYDEVRIWKGALTDEQLNWNAWMGPDTVVIASANKRVCETLNIASGATLSSIYAGTTSFCNRLTGTGTLASHSTFVVEQKLDIAGEGFGTFTVDGRLNVRGDWILSCGASGASDRIVGAGVLDLSEAVLVPQFASKSFGSYLVAKGVTPVGYQNLVLPPRYLLDLADDKLYLRRNGFGIYVR